MHRVQSQPTRPLRRPSLLSSRLASESGDSPPKPTSAAGTAWCTEAPRNCSRNSVETTSAPAARAAAFKNCCMRSGHMDGSERDHYFQGLNSRGAPLLGGGAGSPLFHRHYPKAPFRQVRQQRRERSPPDFTADQRGPSTAPRCARLAQDDRGVASSQATRSQALKHARGASLYTGFGFPSRLTRIGS